ncbi:MAG: TauD/TfdA family dioxygenase [Hyphomicrobiaceae bacterium]
MTPKASGGVGSRDGNPFDLTDEKAYLRWRDWKLASYPRALSEVRFEVADLCAPSATERAAIVDACARCNMAIYRVPVRPETIARQAAAILGDELRQFASAFSLGIVEDHRSAGEDGIVAIEVTEQASKRAFIPYTTRALNWHTDGYYNAPDVPIRSMLLHCARPAKTGGENALLDPEIVYIRVRDASRAELAALMHPEAMTIPESIEEDGRVRPPSQGPVFMIGPGDNALTMRYTARTRNIVWRDDADTRAAVARLDRLLAHGEEPLVFKYRLEAGEGLISNNILHTRTAFENEDEAGRLLLRARYRQRIVGT